MKFKKKDSSPIRTPKRIADPHADKRDTCCWLSPLFEKDQPFKLNGELTWDIMPKKNMVNNKPVRPSAMPLPNYLDAPNRSLDFFCDALKWFNGKVFLGLDENFFEAKTGQDGRIIASPSKCTIAGTIISVNNLTNDTVAVRTRTGRTDIVQRGKVIRSFYSGSRCLWGHAVDAFNENSIIYQDFERPFCIKDIRDYHITIINDALVHDVTSIKVNGNMFAAGYAHGLVRVYDMRQTRSPIFATFGGFEEDKPAMVRDIEWHGSGNLTFVSNDESGGRMATVHHSMNITRASMEKAGEFFVGVHSVNDRIITASNMGARVWKRHGKEYSLLSEGIVAEIEHDNMEAISSTYNAEADKMMILREQNIQMWSVGAAKMNKRRGKKRNRFALLPQLR